MPEEKKVIFIKVNVDKIAETTSFANISAMPTFIAYKNGKEFERLVGANPDKLKALIEKL